MIKKALKSLALTCLNHPRVTAQLHSWGYRLAPTDAVMPTDFQQRLLAAIAERNCRCVIDVGANQGQFARGLRRIGYQGRIVSFEPVAASFEGLERASAADPLWSVHRLALSDAAGEALINISKLSLFNSLHAPNAYGQATFSGEIDISTQERIALDRLDHVLGRLTDIDPQEPLFLKLDTQGHDLAVLAGATQRLQQIALLLVEMPLKPIYDGIPSFAACLDAYAAAGFAPVCFEPVSLDADGAAIEVDGLFVRSGGGKQASA